MGDRSPMAVTGKEDDDDIDQRRISVKWSPGLAERCHGHSLQLGLLSLGALSPVYALSIGISIFVPSSDGASMVSSGALY